MARRATKAKSEAAVVGHATEVERDGFGRPLIIPVGGGKPVAYQRCTTFIDMLSDRYQLEAWKQRMVAIGMSKRPDLVLRAGSTLDKDTLNDVAEAALEAAGSSMQATIGTALHELTERWDRGERPQLPESHAPDIFAYLGATAGIVKRDIEVFVVHDELKVGGTFDRVLEIDGGAYVADLKTGNIDYDTAKIAMQLTVYANSKRYDPKTGARSVLGVSTERGVVIHLPAGEGKCSLYWTDLVQGMKGVQLAAQVRAWRKDKAKLIEVPRG
jgi:hypothetical protein